MNDKYALLTATEHGLIQEVIKGYYHKDSLRASSSAVFALFTRIGNSWRSLHVLLRGSENGYEFATCANDCAAILRCMLDASFQISYILDDSDESAVRGQLYLDFEHVERYTLVTDVLSMDNYFGKRLRESPRRSEAEPRVRAEYERVKGKYTNRDGRVRTHWYPGTLRDLAKVIEREDEYLLFVKQFGSSIHSGPMATRNSPLAATRQAIEDKAGQIVAETASLLAAHEELLLCETSEAIVEGMSREIAAFGP